MKKIFLLILITATCLSNNVFAQGENCDNPISIASGTHSADKNKLWYKYTSPANGVLEVTTCDLTDEETIIELYGGSCENLKRTAKRTCFMQASAELGVTSGDVIFIHFEESYITNNFDFTLSVRQANEGENCLQATKIVAEGTFDFPSMQINASHYYSYTAKQTGRLFITSIDASKKIFISESCNQNSILRYSDTGNVDIHVDKGKTYIIEWINSNGESFSWKMFEYEESLGDDCTIPIVIEDDGIYDITKTFTKGLTYYKYVATQDETIITKEETEIEQTYGIFTGCPGEELQMFGYKGMEMEYQLKKGDSIYIKWMNVMPLSTSWSFRREQANPAGCSSPESVTSGIHSTNNTTENTWYSFTATKAGKVTISSCFQTDIDTKLKLYNDTCYFSSSSDDVCDLQASESIAVKTGDILKFCWSNENEGGAFNWIIGYDNEIDTDGDGVNNDLDAFPYDPTETNDEDGDGIGSNTDDDDDGDGYSDETEIAENADPLDELSIPNDWDGDFITDLNDEDDDNDGVADIEDAFPFDDTETADFDNDGIGNNADTDDDNDGFSDNDELTAGTDPKNSEDFPIDQTDTDGDNIIDSIDTDDDNDGFSDEDEILANTDPLDSNDVPADTDGDTIIDVKDDDDDNDGVVDTEDAFPLDASETIDTDNDGIGNNADTDDDGDKYLDDDEMLAGTDPFDKEDIPSDNDNDYISDIKDTDDDNDGVSDADDAFPFNYLESADTDNDGIGNNTDGDDDNDGFSDEDEILANTNPLDENSIPADTDSDGIIDAKDPDDDNDGVNDEIDAFPLDATEIIDTDGDEIGNNADNDDDNDRYLDEDEMAAGTDPQDNTSIPSDIDGDYISDATDNDNNNNGIPDSQETTSIFEDNILSEFKFFPNPTNDKINLIIPSDATVTIIHIGGAKVYNKQLQAGAHTINIENYPAGNYNLQLSIKGNNKTYPLVIE